MTDAVPDDLVDAVAAAEHLGVKAATVRQWARRYELPEHGREGRRVLYSLADLYAAERRARAAARPGSFTRDA